MKLALAENIRMFRRQRKMTQEKLAEALGVTVGAVYKWESGLSQPELSLIVELADFFDTSVDVLLGYRMKDNHIEAILERLNRYCLTLDPAGLAEAEKALGKYPNSFQIVYACANGYIGYGANNHNPENLRRALELLEKSNTLLSQNRDPRISEAAICGGMATVRFLLKEHEKGLELLKQNNTCGMYSSQIGAYLAAWMNRPEEAAPYLSEALLNSFSDLLTAIVGYVFVYRSRNNWTSALAITQWGLDFLTGLKAEAAPDFLDKIHAEMLALLAYVQAKSGMRESSAESLRQAGAFAHRFDTQPDYTLRAMRFADHMDQTAVFDIFGATASESVASLYRLLDDPELSQKWEEIQHDKQ